MASKVLLEHYNGIRELNRDDLVFMFSHLFKDVLENTTPVFPRFPNTQKEFWEWLVDKWYIIYLVPRLVGCYTFTQKL